MTGRLRTILHGLTLGFILAGLSAPAALAQDASAAVPKLDGANTAWVLVATALVLFMTVPALALFYGGLVRSKNVLSVLMHCMAICCLVSVLWLAVGYTLAFSNGGTANAWIGGFGKVFLAGVGPGAQTGDIPEVVYFMFQMTFAIITPALMVGAYPERVDFGAVLLISGLWLLLVYVPVAHWVWGGGWLARMGALDFAGGLVVHTTAGASALVIALMLGARRGFPREITPPHNPGMVMTGAAMLWVGWYGFNGGSALAANGNAGMAIAATHLAAAAASLTWMVLEWKQHGRPSLVGFVTGTIAGLATITPASGFVGASGGLAIGIIAGVVCYIMVALVKQRLQIDDSLDVFAVHGVGGMTGSLLTAVFALPALGGLGLAKGMTAGHQLWVQAVGVVATAAWSIVATVVIVMVVSALTKLRVSDEDETEGLDLTTHGERGYNL